MNSGNVGVVMSQNTLVPLPARDSLEKKRKPIGHRKIVGKQLLSNNIPSFPFLLNQNRNFNKAK